MKNLLLYLGLLISTISFAQSYSIGWFTIDGGGTSTGGVYSLSGTIGQPDEWCEDPSGRADAVLPFD